MDIENILQPIAQKDVAGKPDLDSEVYTALDNEIMKIGSLQHGDVNWQLVEQQSIVYLHTVCKDYKVFGYLVKSLLRDTKAENLDLCLINFVKFNKDFLFLSHPTPDKKSIKGAKSKALKLILNYFEECLKSKQLHLNNQQYESVLTQLGELYSQLKNSKPLAETTAKLLELAKNLQTRIEASSNTPTETPELSTTSQVNDANLPPNIEGVSFNNHRETKLSYFKVSEHCNRQSPDDSLGYRLRRYAMWHGISMLPQQNADGITQMTAVASDRIFDYKETLNTTPSVELLRKIEKTLETSPFWIEGNFLSASCANSLGYKEVENTIHQTTIEFVNCFSTFQTAKFNNGVPFITDEINDWLTAEKVTPPTDTLITIHPHHSLDDLVKCYEEEGLIEVLKQIDVKYQMANDVREQFNYRLEKIHYLMKAEIYDLCRAELKEIRELAREYTILEWERSFFQKIDNMLSKVEK